MAKKLNRSYSQYTTDALALLAGLVRAARLERKFTVQEVADRAGVSRGLIQRIERADPKCEVGVVLEVATIVGVPLFEVDEGRLHAHRVNVEEKLALLPQSARKPTGAVDDDF